MKLSIVTSYYNSEKFIDEQAESILSQTYQNWEWIICDDFSSDGTLSKLEDLSKRDPRIKLVTPRYKKEIWWNPQTYATGDIVCPIDGDDKILPKTFEKIVYYFNKFPDVVLLHFNANKYNNVLPKNSDSILNNFYDNVYISRDNVSFLDAFERLWWQRSCIFGYLRIFRNIPGLKFKVHPDGNSCSSNDGQWLLQLEEIGKCMAIPRTTYIARQHGDSENFRNWSIRGEANLVTDAQERRKEMDLEMPRISDYFNEIYVAAESTYLSRLNWEDEPRSVCFYNYGYSAKQKLKLQELFFDHEISFDSFDREYDYSFVRIKQDSTANEILKLVNSCTGDISLFCDNIHLHNDNRTGRNTLEEIKAVIEIGNITFWNTQENRAILYIAGKKEEKMAGERTMDEVLLKGYEETIIRPQEKRDVENTVSFNFVDGPKVHVNGPKDAEYLVRFIDTDTGNEVHTATIRNNWWCNCSVKYSMKWRIEVYENGNLWKVHNFDPTGKRVFIHLDSNSLGDTLAWFPYAEEYRKQKNCTVIVSSHRNYFFEGKYPDLIFAKPGEVVHDLYASFGLGWYYNDEGEVDKYKNPFDFKQFPLQQTATDILDIEFKEVKPVINIEEKGRSIPGPRPYICIAPHASALAKYWNYPGGWQALINELNRAGYDVVMITQEKHGHPHDDAKLGGKLTNIIDKTGDLPLEDRINDLKYASAFIGVGSGLSWLAWSVGTPVIMISGFSETWTEFESGCARVIDESVCHGCFNRVRLDPADWQWCPDKKGTPEQFICSRTITPKMVMEKINNFL